jgi:hypothetical protein
MLCTVLSMMLIFSPASFMGHRRPTHSWVLLWLTRLQSTIHWTKAWSQL